MLAGAAESRRRQHRNLKVLSGGKDSPNQVEDMGGVFEDSELSDAFPGVAHHVADSLRLDGLAALTCFQFCLVLEVKGQTGGGDATSKGVQTRYSRAVWMSHHGPAFALLTLAGEIIGLSQPVVAVFCWIEDVDVADEHLRQAGNTTQRLHTSSLWVCFCVDGTDHQVLKIVF